MNMVRELKDLERQANGERDQLESGLRAALDSAFSTLEFVAGAYYRFVETKAKDKS